MFLQDDFNPYKGYVYFIAEEDNQRIKIGFAMNPYKRIKQLQTGNSKTLKILKIIPGDQKVERAYHKHFAMYKQRGEWFQLSEEILAFIYR